MNINPVKQRKIRYHFWTLIIFCLLILYLIAYFFSERVALILGIVFFGVTILSSIELLGEYIEDNLEKINENIKRRGLAN